MFEEGASVRPPLCRGGAVSLRFIAARARYYLLVLRGYLLRYLHIRAAKS